MKRDEVVASQVQPGGGGTLGVGVLLAVVGAILTFAVRANTTVINLPIAGVIFMIAGGLLIWHGSKGHRRKRIITREEGPNGVTNTVRQTIEERDID